MRRRTSACRKELEQPRRRTQVQALGTLRDHRYVLISNSCYANHLTQKLVVAPRKPSSTCQPVYKQARELVHSRRAGLVSLLHEHLVFLPSQKPWTPRHNETQPPFRSLRCSLVCPLCTAARFSGKSKWCYNIRYQARSWYA